MKSTFVASTITLLIAFQVSSVCARHIGSRQAHQKSSQASSQKITIGTNEILLDVVVRDKRGRPVRDLKANDFEIYEDGVKQDVQSFHLYSQDEDNGKGVAAKALQEHPGALPDSFDGVNVVALVFDRLSPGARELAHQAALDYVAKCSDKDLFAGVFISDLSLNVIQPFTNNRELLDRALDRAASTATTKLNSQAISAQIAFLEKGQVSSINDPQAISDAARAGGYSAESSLGAPLGDQPSDFRALDVWYRMTIGILSGYEMLEQNEQGFSTTDSLLAIIDAIRRVPGRKSIIFFSEGIEIPPIVAARLRSVISAANRANVSFYPLDAAGLRTHSQLAATALQIHSAGSVQASRNGEDTSGQPMTRNLERNEDALGFDPDSALADLADQTGGLLIDDTNDLKNGLARINEDMRFHYELSYVPKNSGYDGRFRQISVKLDRPGLDLQTRKGYYAVPDAGAPVLDYEVKPLAALASSRANEDQAMEAAAFSFPTRTSWVVPVLVQVPASSFTYEIDETKNRYSADFTILALLKDQSGRSVGKVSQHYHMSGPADRVEAAKQGQVLFYRETELPPGRYTVHAIAFDTPSGKAEEKGAEVEVPVADSNSLRLSSVTVLDRAERLSEAEKKASNPFHFGELLIYPDMSAMLYKSNRKDLAFFFTVYPAKGRPSSLKLKIDIATKDGRQLAEVSPNLPPPDPDGKIQFASAFPLGSFPVGEYILKVTVADGQASASRSTQFAVQN